MRSRFAACIKGAKVAGMMVCGLFKDERKCRVVNKAEKPEVTRKADI
jgi:hypothetical protein